MKQAIIKPLNKDSIQERFKKAFVLLTVFILSLFISQTIFVHAADPPDDPPAAPTVAATWPPNWESSDAASSLGKTVFGLAYDVYSGDALISDDVIDDLNVNLRTYDADLWSLVQTLYNAVATTGTLLLLLYWLMDILEKVQMESFTLEHFVRASIKLIVGVLLVTNGLDILIGIFGFASGIFANLGNVTASDAGANNSILNAIWDEAVYHKQHMIKGVFALIGRMAQLIVPAFVMMLIRIVIYVVVYSRIIELFVLSVFAPIGMANIYTGGMNSSGFRYLKRILAVALTGCVMFVVLRGYFTLSSIVNQNLLSASAGITQLVLGATALMLVIKSQSWAKDIVGV